MEELLVAAFTVYVVSERAAAQGALEASVDEALAL